MTDKDIFKDMTYESLNKQIDGTHYKVFKIEPSQFISENHLEWAEGEAIKYLKEKKKVLKKQCIVWR